jgi:hypothetical protein
MKTEVQLSGRLCDTSMTQDVYSFNRWSNFPEGKSARITFLLPASIPAQGVVSTK